MTDLRNAFCRMLEAYPGPDANGYKRWAHSGDPEDTANLASYVRATIAAIERFGHADEHVHLPMLRALHTELAAGATKPTRIDAGNGRVWAYATAVDGWIELPEFYNVSKVRAYDVNYDPQIRTLTLSEVERAKRGEGPVMSTSTPQDAAYADWHAAPDDASPALTPGCESIEARWTGERRDQVWCAIFLHCLPSLDAVAAEARADAAVKVLEARKAIEAMHDVLTAEGPRGG